MLQISELSLAYDAPILRNVSLTLEPGQNGFLLGPSGAGKSSILRCIAGLERNYSGTISWDGAPLDARPPHERGVGMVMQEPSLFPHLNVWQNVAFGLRYRNVARPKRCEEAHKFLEMVELDHLAERHVDALSGGQRQRVELARTLAAEPKIVLLDEPLSALDVPLRHKLGPRIATMLADQGVAALWVTHDEKEARRLGDPVWHLSNGAVSALDTADSEGQALSL